jgi:transposase
MKATPRKASYRRLLAIRLMLMGYRPAEVARMHAVSRSTTLSWVKRFNERGIDGLLDAPRAGRPRKISPEQSAAYRRLIEKPELAGQVHWTARKFHGYLRRELQHEVGYSTLLRWLHDNNFRLKVPQPWPDRQDEAQRRAWLEGLRALLSDPQVELWYSDECGVEGDPRPRRRWAQRGKKARVTRNGDHIRMSVCGAVCPRTGEFYALEFTHSNTDAFQAFLDHANKDLGLQRPRNILICDNASWHKTKTLKWGALEPLYLPPYSPDFNPIEKLWLVIKAEWFTDFIAKSREQLIARLDQALLWAMGRRKDNQRTCSIEKKL